MAYGIVENGVVTQGPIQATPEHAASMGYIEIPDHAQVGWREVNGGFLPPSQPAPTSAEIDAERDRRIRAGMTFEGVRYQTDDKSRDRIDKSRVSALAASIGGAQPGDLRWHGQPVDFFWIAEDNMRIFMDAQTMIGFGNAAAAREGMHIAAASDLKSAEGGIPSDYTEDKWWSAT